MTNHEDPPLRYVDSKSLSSLKAPPTHGHGIWWIVNLIICCENCVKDTELYIFPHLFPVFRVIVKNALALKFNVDLTTRFEFGAQHDFQSCTFGCQFCQTHLLLMSHSSTLETTGILAPVDADERKVGKYIGISKFSITIKLLKWSYTCTKNTNISSF